MSKLWLHYYQETGPWPERNWGIVLDTDKRAHADQEFDKVEWGKNYEYYCYPIRSGMTIQAFGYDAAFLNINPVDSLNEIVTDPRRG